MTAFPKMENLNLLDDTQDLSLLPNVVSKPDQQPTCLGTTCELERVEPIYLHEDLTLLVHNLLLIEQSSLASSRGLPECNAIMRVGHSLTWIRSMDAVWRPLFQQLERGSAVLARQRSLKTPDLPSGHLCLHKHRIGFCHEQTEQLVTLWILFIVTIAGNATVLFSTWRRKRKSRMTYFVTQLAITGTHKSHLRMRSVVSISKPTATGHYKTGNFTKVFADSFTGLINIMTDIIWRYTGDFMAPDIVCRVVRYFQVVLLYASTYVLVSLSIDRYHAIVYPMKFLQGERQAKVLIGVAWSLSFLFSIPTLIIFGKRQLSNGEVQCWALWPDDSYWIPYMTVVAFLVYFIPLIIISVIYSIVIRTIWMKSKAQAVILSSCPGGTTSAGYTSRGFISRAKVKAIKYSIVIILAFVLCWSPYFLFDILDNFNILPETKERFYASVIIQNLPALNSAINPLIYCFFSNRLCPPFEYCSFTVTLITP
ncbi:Neuropeptide S receptor [Pitangus sulphuratus]|nr:Neuropeptide S receptor [Pitangus sulphuratus]